MAYTQKTPLFFTGPGDKRKASKDEVKVDSNAVYKDNQGVMNSAQTERLLRAEPADKNSAAWKSWKIALDKSKSNFVKENK